MAYQSVGKPRFYVSYGLWHIALGLDIAQGNQFEESQIRDILQLNPSTTVIDLRPNAHWFEFDDMGFNFVFFLGHKFASGATPNNIIVDNNGVGVGAFDFSVNLDNGYSADYNGWSLGGFNDTPFTDGTIRINIVGSFTCNSIAFGTYYDMPHSPDLSLTMSREYGGIKEFTTHNGSSMSNAMWSKPPKWGDLGAWELGSGDPKLSKSGRRSWDLKFSYLDDGDLWGSNQTLGNLSSDFGGVYTPPLSTYGADFNDYDTSDVVSYENSYAFNFNLLTDDSFFSQVWHKTLGGTLPFIFQPDVNDNTNFAICKFKDNSLKATQSAFNVYDISLSIEEVW